MSTDTFQSFRTLDGGIVTGRSKQQAQLAAKSLGTKLLIDSSKLEQDSYKHRFSNQHNKVGICCEAPK